MKKVEKNEQKKTVDWQKIQVYLFNLIKDRIPKGIGLIDEIMDVLGVSRDTAYRKVKGSTDLTPGELCILCKKYHISMDKIIELYYNGESTLFEYSAINPAVNDTYIQYMQQLSERHTALSQSVDCVFFLTAAEIPFYYFRDYRELLYFRLYRQHNTLSSQNISYEDFCEQLDKNSIMSIYKQEAEKYMKILSIKEIWCYHTVSGILQSLKYCAMSKCFENERTVLLLLKQLSELISTVEKEASEGRRRNQQTPFELYISTVDVTNNIILIRNGKKFTCDIRLFTANCLFIDEEHFCSDIYKEINDFISTSLLVSHRLKQERCQFFKDLQNQITELMLDIEKQLENENK
jgi:hypothetical protein